MIEKIFQKLLGKAYPERDFEAVKIGKKVFTVVHDSLGSLDYSLQGTHSYEEVKKLNELTTCSARYGYCKEKGPIAIIGIPNDEADWGYFQEVSVYGQPEPNEEFEFQKYSEDVAKQIGNYTVYGVHGIDEIADFVKFDKIASVYDSRFKEVRYSHEYRVLKMKCKLEGQYSFEEAKKLAKTQQRWAVDRGIAFATLEDGQHIAIMSFWYGKKDEVAGFRDVWETGKSEPSVQKIDFMTDEEAMKIKDFSIYLYDYNFFYQPQTAPNIIKIDRTFASNFNFYDTPDRKDMRLS